MTSRLRGVFFALALAAGGAACREAGPSAEITTKRIASHPSSPVIPGATVAQRFGAESEKPRAPSDDVPSFEYDLPEGWVAVAPTRERQINLRPAGDPEAECYLSVFPGDGGGLAANINRWRGQFGAATLSEEEIGALPTVPLFNRNAVQVEAEGSFKSVGSNTAKPGFRLLGLVISEPAASLFLKFTAPAGLVELEREHFFAFARSLRGGEARQETAAAGEASASRLKWEVPPGWTIQPPRMMREVSFTLPQGAECYITRLPGDAGGLRMNLDRWCSQVGREPLTDEAFAALERIDVLGQKTPLLELEGAFTGMDGVERSKQGLLGVACIRGEESLFVKLTGPESVVRAERANFRFFVESLEDAQ